MKGGERTARRNAMVAGLTLLLCEGAVADVHLAQVAPMTGPISVEGKEYNIGAKTAIEAANAAGGVSGHKIIFQTEDDEYNPEKTVAIMRRLASGPTLGLLMPVGSPSMTKVLQDKVLESAKLPIVGIVPGAEPLRNPLNPYLYHVRAGDVDQYRRLVEHATTTGQKRIAVVYADIPFGKAGLATVEGLLKAQGLEPVARAAFPIGTNINFSAPMSALKTALPDVVILISPAAPAGEFVKAYRESGMAASLSTLSYGNSDTICRIAGPEKARGVALAQVFPNVRNNSTPIVRDFLADMRKYGPQGNKPNLMQLEAYVATRVMLEGLRRAGSAPTREKLVQALDTMREVNLGGFTVDFSPTKHTGSRYVDMSIIGQNCQLVF